MCTSNNVCDTSISYNHISPIDFFIVGPGVAERHAPYYQFTIHDAQFMIGRRIVVDIIG